MLAAGFESLEVVCFEVALGPEQRGWMGVEGGGVDLAYELFVKIREKNDIIIPSFPHLMSKT